MCNEYNGHANYQTWNVALWLDNDENNYYHIRDLAAHEMETRNTEDLPIWSLATKIKDYVEESNPLINDASMFSDLLQHALDNVEYEEIAENILSEFEES